MRVFLGTTEIANVVHNYAKGFQALGIPTFTVVSEKSRPYPDSTYDLVMNEDFGEPPMGPGLASYLRRQIWRARYYGVFLRAALTCDVFIFVFGSSFRSRRQDYALLKQLGKKIVCVFLGDDSRYWYAYTQEAELLGTAPEIRPYLDEVLRERPHDYLAAKLATVRTAEQHADLILSLPEMAQLQTRPYMRVNIPVDLAALRFNVPDREIPLVVHAPSVRGIKGSDYVLAAVEQLRSEGVNFEFQLIERMPNSRLRELLSESDIVVDQLYSETVATLALEGLATGNAVLARYLSQRSRIPAECPVMNVTVATLASQLRSVIVDRELRRRLAHAGRQYVADHHANDRVAAEILAWLRPGAVRSFDFEPSFFRNHFAMSPELAAREAKSLPNEPVYFHAVPLSDVRFSNESRGSVLTAPLTIRAEA